MRVPAARDVDGFGAVLQKAVDEGEAHLSAVRLGELDGNLGRIVWFAPPAEGQRARQVPTDDAAAALDLAGASLGACRDFFARRR